MEFQRYKKCLNELPFGKKLKNTVYVHWDSLNQTDSKLKVLINSIIKNYNVTAKYNVIKFSLKEAKFSFLYYPGFFEIPHPQLKISIIINSVKKTLRKIDYTKSSNPPILHRKETLLAAEHPLIKKFKALTKEEEKRGLYKNNNSIGTKKNWDQLLEQKGLCYKGHQLINRGEKDVRSIEIKVKRHKTAIKRYNFSKPIQTIQENNLLRSETSLLDFGCGKGDDVQALRKLGFDAFGWDPVFKPNEEKIKSDIVNLGFVLNVIEDQTERSNALKEAFELSEKLLVVSTMVASSSTEKLGKPYKDGILTKNETFQKYFRQNELRDYIESTLSVGAIAAGPGTFYIFKDPIEQQEYLSSRSRRSINWIELSRGLYPDRPGRMRKKDLLYKEHKDLVDIFWERMLELGRIPEPEEFEETKDLRSRFGTPNAARKLFVEKFGEDTLKEAFELRKNDILVYLALSNFKKKVPFYHLSTRLQNDIKTFLGSYKAGIEKSLELLFSIGNPDIITKLCNETEFGYFDHKALYIHKDLIKDLHPIIRIYIGCAGILYGDLRNADLIKIHKKSGKVTLLIYDDFKKKSFPELIERVKVNLRKQQIDFFDHKSETHQQVLYFKERYVPDKYPLKEKWTKFSKKLSKIGIDSTVMYGPTKQELLELTKAHGLTINLNKKRVKNLGVKPTI